MKDCNFSPSELMVAKKGIKCERDNGKGEVFVRRSNERRTFFHFFRSTGHTCHEKNNNIHSLSLSATVFPIKENDVKRSHGTLQCLIMYFLTQYEPRALKFHCIRENAGSSARMEREATEGGREEQNVCAHLSGRGRKERKKERSSYSFLSSFFFFSSSCLSLTGRGRGGARFSTRVCPEKSVTVVTATTTKVNIRQKNQVTSEFPQLSKRVKSVFLILQEKNKVLLTLRQVESDKSALALQISHRFFLHVT